LAQPLSVVLVVQDAAALLPACLASVAFADDVVVVDSGSSDGTAECAARHGARVVQRDWMGFGLQKQFAVGQARNDWVLCLDADERVSPELDRSMTIGEFNGAAALPADSAPAFASPLYWLYEMGQAALDPARAFADEAPETTLSPVIVIAPTPLGGAGVDADKLPGSAATVSRIAFAIASSMGVPAGRSSWRISTGKLRKKYTAMERRRSWSMSPRITTCGRHGRTSRR